jgi:hypothetical protein
MTLTIDISPEKEVRLRKKAAMAGVAPPEYVRNLVEDDLDDLTEHQKAMLAVLDSFMEQDEEVHRDTMECLRVALNEDRPGQRRIFGEGYNPPAEAAS